MINGNEKEAVFETVSIKENIFKAGRIYFCSHLTSNHSIPEYMSYKNNVLGITEITIIDNNPLLVLENTNKISDKIKIDKQENLIAVKTDDIKINLYIKNLSKTDIIRQEINIRKSMFGS